MRDVGGVTLSWRAPPPTGLQLEEQPQVFAFRLDAPASQVAELQRLLAPDERARAARFRRSADRRHYVVARGQLRTVLGHLLGRDPQSLGFRYGAHGKPVLSDGQRHQPVHFNMSRSHALGLLAIQLDEELGVDVEWIRPLPRVLDIAERFFAAAEHEVLRALARSDLDGAFFDYWTRKEAVVKSVGLGLSQPMDTFVLDAPPGRPAQRVVVVSGEGDVVRWCLSLPSPAPGYPAAFATGGPPRSPQCWAWAEPPFAHQ